MKKAFAIFFFQVAGLCLYTTVHAQSLHKYKDSIVFSNEQVQVVFHPATGKLDYHFAGSISLDNTVAYVQDLHAGMLTSAELGGHTYRIEKFRDSLGSGATLTIRHADKQHDLYILQHISLYSSGSWLLVGEEAARTKGTGPLPETRNISPIAILPAQLGSLVMPGAEPRILDEPFDNDDWVGVVERKWPGAGAMPGSGSGQPAEGISYEFSAVYDNTSMAGLVLGSVEHDFWKTGIVYRSGPAKGLIDSLVVYGGAAVPDNPALPRAYGGQDGTHDLVPHGTMIGATLHSPLIFIGGGKDVRTAFTAFGKANARLNGSLSWKGYAPIYWNSFGVEDVLGHKKIMMPEGVRKISDFIHTLDNFSRYAKPVLSIDSYDQSIYTTDTLAALGEYAMARGQQMGFYFIPFAAWTWKSSINNSHDKLHGTDYDLQDVLLKDANNRTIPYKDGAFGAYPLDPTHPAVRQLIIGQLEKARAIHARFLKIDFLSAGALESPRHYDPSVRSGMQAYNQGMKMLKHLIDSIMGPDIFITEAISPMFPSQYAHTRFNSTDVYSHLRDDEPGFPNWGSTESSLATGSHLGWVQGTLWPFTNMDVTIMKAFQKNPDLNEQEIKTRIYALMVMGSILGDGSDLRQPLAAQRAGKFLNNPAVCAFFSHPVAFTPLQFADGDSFDQQLSFFLKAGLYNPDPAQGRLTGKPGIASPALFALFNFSGTQEYKKSFDLGKLGLADGAYSVRDFMTDEEMGKINKGQNTLTLTVPIKDALLVKLVPGQ